MSVSHQTAEQQVPVFFECADEHSRTEQLPVQTEHRGEVDISMSLLMLFAVSAVILQLSQGSSVVRVPNDRDGGDSVEFTCTWDSTATSSRIGDSTTATDWRVQPRGRAVYAIGDLHGDWNKTVAALQLVGALQTNSTGRNSGLEWAGGDRIVVQVGDVLDRGNSELGISNLLGCLDAQARASGGRLIRIIGNHELMNAMGQFGYATRRGTQQYGGAAARKQTFAPGGPEARRLAELNVVQMVGDTLFVHGGLLPEHASHAAIEAINAGAKAWLRGGAAARRPIKALTSSSGPLWTREYWSLPKLYDSGQEIACKQLEVALQRAGATRMVVGHTIMPDGEIGSACQGQLWGVDVGMSAGMRGAAPAALLVDAGSVEHGSGEGKTNPTPLYARRKDGENGSPRRRDL